MSEHTITEISPWKPDADGKLRGFATKVSTSLYTAVIVAPTLEDLAGMWGRMSDEPFNQAVVRRVAIDAEDVR